MRSRAIVFGLCLAVILNALLVMTGWLTHRYALVQLAPGLVPVQFNTAVGLLGLALSICLSKFQHAKASAAAATLACAIGFVSLLEWVIGSDLGIDHLIVRSALVTAQSPIPGRVSPVSAVFLVILGIGFLELAIMGNKVRSRRLLGILSTFCGIASIVLVVSEVTRIGAIYQMSQYNQMSIQTGICFAFLSIASFFVARKISITTKLPIGWTASAAVLGLAVGTIIWAQAEAAQEKHQASVTTYEKTDGIRYHLESLISQDVRALDRMSRRLSLGIESSETSWRRDAGSYIHDCPEMLSLEWIDPKLNIRWTMSHKSNWSVSGLPTLSQERRIKALSEAQRTGRLMASDVIGLGDGSYGFFVFAPVSKDHEVGSVISAVLRIGNLVDTLPNRTLKRYRLEAVEGNHSIYLSGSKSIFSASPSCVLPISCFGSKWSLGVSPTEETLANWMSPMPKLILVCGVITSFLIGFLIFLSHKAREVQEFLRQSNNALEQVIGDASIGMALVSPKGSWLRVNKSLCDLVGYSEEELLTIDFQTITHPDDVGTDEAYVAEMLEGSRRTYEMEKRYIRKDGEHVWVLLSVSLVRGQNGEPVYFISQILDISERKAANLQLQEYADVLEIQKRELLRTNDQLETIATTDGLTKVSNRRHFDEELSQQFNIAQRYALPLTMILVDIDHFKSVNDKFGHLTGDSVLIKVAKILKETARDSDIVARYGGEEFALICPHTDLISGAFLAERLRALIAEATFDCGNLTASFGVASLGIGDKEVRTLITNADEALYESKRKGRNRVSLASTGGTKAA